MTPVYVADNQLSFIETSALDASNVDASFQNILTGEHSCSFRCLPRLRAHLRLDIYRIVSSKSLAENSEIIKPSEGNKIPLDPSVDPNATKAGGKCC